MESVKRLFSVIDEVFVDGSLSLLCLGMQSSSEESGQL